MTKKTLIITGACGGLGQALVKALSSSFPDLHIMATDIDPGVGSLSGKLVRGMEMDVTNEDHIIALRQVMEEKGLVAWAIINNAGISDFFPVSEKEKDSLEKMFAVNTFGAVNMVRTFLPHLRESRGRVVNISSESLRLPAPFHPYAATKASLEALSVSMRNELALFGIRLIIVRPGAIDTAMLDDLNDLRDHTGESAYSPYFRRFANKAPRQVRKVVKPEKVAGVVIKALQRKNPRSYYLVNNNPVLRIAQLLPHRVRDHFMQRMIK